MAFRVLHRWPTVVLASFHRRHITQATHGTVQSWVIRAVPVDCTPVVVVVVVQEAIRARHGSTMPVVRWVVCTKHA
uniref:Putative secreted peptide n=1 Tax=Anopheles braziliensis TaxID=58242 RepID=A0A2M3ZT61_9DIPT